ncbi:MAG: hypothetical protein ACTIDZ_00180 [Staphylococcus sp.]|uniref:hypothetical protein n=1 Tax=Staphylococcus TaxID=1279 RepID=UPI000D1E3C97|nr:MULTISPECIES: hypothetical protein [Staphylococcus]PTK20878.1 hypothetical protein BUZ72_03350 [Staphylococcus saprophyticus]RYD11403.1 hypothetical protein CGA19_13440 [Staphylococcus equorum]
MNNTTFAFGINKIINRFDAHTQEFEQIPISRENFKTLTDEFPSEFNFYFQDNILIVPTSKLEPNQSWHKSLLVNKQIIEFNGRYIYFFNYKEVKENILFITPLTLPQTELIKNRLYLIDKL